MCNLFATVQVLNDETFAILVLMALFTTFITTPTVMALYKPARRGSARIHRKLRDFSATNGSTKDELRILACAHGPGNVPSLISLVEATRSTKKQLKLYIMHLVELTERSSSIIMVQRVRKNGIPFTKRSRSGEWHDRVAGGFQAYRQLGRVSVRPITAISPLSTMHEDICHVAEDKGVTMLILPFHKQWRRGDDDDEESIENVGHGWRCINQRVLKDAPCSVGLIVDRGFGNGSRTPGPTATVAQRICILFFGGPDDREAMELGGMMAEHPAVKVTVVRFVGKNESELDGVTLRRSPTRSSEKNYSFSTVEMNREKEKELDETVVAEFRSKWDGVAEYTEKKTSNVVEAVLAIGRSSDYELVVVGKGRFPSGMVADLADRQAEHAELGPIGDILASSGQGVVSSVLVVQQHDLALADEAPLAKMVHVDNEKFRADVDQSSGSAGEISKVV